jgi:hypothetical protein
MKSEKFLILNSTRTHVINLIVADIDFVNKKYPNQWMKQDTCPDVSVGYIYNSEKEIWEAPLVKEESDDRPELVCEELLVECTDSKALSLDFEIHNEGKMDKDFNERFCVPIVSVDGREVLVLFEFKNGKFKLKTTMKTSGVWKITETQVNLYSNGNLKFNGVTILVFQE